MLTGNDHSDQQQEVIKIQIIQSYNTSCEKQVLILLKIQEGTLIPYMELIP